MARDLLDNHFGEYIDSFMARQTAELPPAVMEQVRRELKKQRVTDLTTLTHKRVRTIMKDLRLNKFYDFTAAILYELADKPAPHISPTVENELKTNFELIQKPFQRAIKKVAPTRKRTF